MSFGCLLIRLFLCVVCCLVGLSGVSAYTPGTGDLFTANFTDGNLAPLTNYPVPAIGFGNFTVRAGEQAAWANGMYGRTGGTGSPGYGQSTAIAPFTNPADYSVAFRLEPEVPNGVNLYLVYATLRPQNDYTGKGWQFNVDASGKMFIRRYKGSGQFGPDLVESATGVVRLDKPGDQYVRCFIAGPPGNVVVRMKVWSGTPESEPGAWTIEGVDTDPDPLGGNLGAFFNVLYIPPLTVDPGNSGTAGTILDDVDVFDETEPPSAVDGWGIYH